MTTDKRNTENADTVQAEISLLRNLRAVRQFEPTALPEAVVNDILEVARWTGSSKNEQPWEFVLVSEPKVLEALSTVGGYVTHLAGAALAIVLVMRGEQAEPEIFDEGRLAERIMLAAAAHGVGSGVGWFSDAGVPQVKTLLHIPTERRVRTAVALGYPSTAATQRRNPLAGRKPIAELVHEEHYR